MNSACTHEWMHLRRIHIANPDGQSVTYYDVYACVFCLEYRRTEVPSEMRDHWQASR